MSSSVAWVSSLCNNYIFDFLYLIHLFSLILGSSVAWVSFKFWFFTFICFVHLIFWNLGFKKNSKLGCYKDDLNANLCFVFFCIHQCGAAGCVLIVLMVLKKSLFYLANHSTWVFIQLASPLLFFCYPVRFQPSILWPQPFSCSISQLWVIDKK